MNIEIYGIEEEKYKCGACDATKTILNDAGLPYTFKRIVKLNVDGFPEHDKELYEELKDRIHVSRLMMPYIFVDNVQIKVSKLKEFLEDKGYEV